MSFRVCYFQSHFATFRVETFPRLETSSSRIKLFISRMAKTKKWRTFVHGESNPGHSFAPSSPFCVSVLCFLVLVFSFLSSTLFPLLSMNSIHSLRQMAYSRNCNCNASPPNREIWKSSKDESAKQQQPPRLGETTNVTNAMQMLVLMSSRH